MSRSIYQISVGEGPRSSMTFHVGQQTTVAGKDISITNIVESKNHFFLFGKMRFTIYAKVKDGEEFEWRFFEDMPIAVTYNIPS